ncbi:MAG: acetolactate decarboxylase [bacterium]|nr:acetolactate decarboxylase [bacterium]
MNKKEKIFFQVSTATAVFEKVYDGEVSFGELKRYGNLGIGLVNSIDGEFLAVDGQYYQFKVDAGAHLLPDSTKTPTANITWFESEKSVVSDEPMDFDKFTKYLDTLTGTKNIFYAFRIEGLFKHVKTRSVPKQEKPYLPLLEVVKQNRIFEYNNQKGTAVGFWVPHFMTGLAVTGYHLHFITDDRKFGGHLLECSPENVKIDIENIYGFQVVLPENTTEFDNAKLVRDIARDVKTVESEN